MIPDGLSEEIIGGLRLSTLSETERQAILAMDLLKDAFARARFGATWLDEHAPSDWRLQMMSVQDGIISSQVRMHRNTENPLALAFRRDPRFRGLDGRVIWAMVAKHFLFDDGKRGVEQAEFRGFLEKEHRVGSTVIDRNVDAYFLNAGWAEVLRDFSWHEIVPPYRTKEFA